VFALISIALAALVFLFIRWLIRGPYGLLITAMRDDELVYTSLGRNAMKVKLVIFGIGCACAGLAGGLYAYYYQYVNPDQFEILQSSMILTMVVVGGMGSQWGPVVGAVLLLFMPQAIGFLNFPPSVMAPLQGLLYSLLVIVFLFVRPQGLMASFDRNSSGSTK
jgi:branched-chain amino acid transport system permease protein